MHPQARCAAVGVDAATVELLRECFREFHIELDVLSAGETERLENERFEGCVLPLDESAEAVLKVARSAGNAWRMVIYGIAKSPEEAVKFSRYGINAVFPAADLPRSGNGAAKEAERQAAMRVVQATYRMVINEMRRFIRVPMVTEVRVESAGRQFTAYSQEVGAGGISLTGAAELEPGLPAELSFVLLETPRIHVSAAVSWFKEPDEIGLGFDRSDPRRLHVRDWVDRYLENVE